MVPGIDKFREHFAGHEASYALIGGAACSLIFDEVGVDFRATRDIDMVLCVEVVDKKFGQALKGFLDAGQYEARERGEERREFYRFYKPKDTSYPEMLELFSSPDAGIEFGEGDDGQSNCFRADAAFVRMEAVSPTSEFDFLAPSARNEKNAASALRSVLLRGRKPAIRVNRRQNKILKKQVAGETDVDGWIAYQNLRILLTLHNVATSRSPTHAPKTGVDHLSVCG